MDCSESGPCFEAGTIAGYGGEFGVPEECENFEVRFEAGVAEG